MQKRIFGSMRQAMQRSKRIKESEEKVREIRDTRVMKEVLSTLNNMKEIKHMREKALDSLFSRLTYRLTALTFYTIRNFAHKQTQLSQAYSHFRHHTVIRVFKALRDYKVRKAKEDNDFRLARKFRYVS